MQLNGLTAAVFTPIAGPDGLQAQAVEPMVARLLDAGVDGFYVAGTTGEGTSLLREERMELVEAFVAAGAGRAPVLANVGHESLAEARKLAAHACAAGVDAIGATAPSYYPIQAISCLVTCVADVAGAAPDTPFVYYHIPQLTGIELPIVDFLGHAVDAVPNLRGVKFSSPKLHEFQACQARFGDRLSFVWGVDEMLLPALSIGAKGAIGSTYNFAAPLYRRIIAAFDRGDLDAARAGQGRAVALVEALQAAPYLASAKRLMAAIGMDCGGVRPPLPSISDEAWDAVLSRLRAIGYFDWSGFAEVADA